MPHRTARRSRTCATSSTAAGERIKALDAALAETEGDLDDLLLRIPNPPDPDIPVGGEEANVTIRLWGEQLPRDQPLVGEVGADAPVGGATWTRKPHWELGEALDIFDHARGAKIAGSGFPVYKGAGSALQRALINWFLDVHTRENGMTEVWPPAVVNTASATGTGQIPDKEDQMYVVTRDELYLVPTAEVPVTNLHRDEILEASELPIRYAAYTPCFRREAGAAGKDTRGILRVHQFDKVEMVLFEKPESSAEALEWMTGARRDPPPAPRPGVPRAADEHPARWASRRRASTTSRSGHRAWNAGSKSARVRTSATTSHAGWPSATGRNRAPSRSSSTPSTAPGWPWRASSRPSSRPTSSPTARSRSRSRCGPTWDATRSGPPPAPDLPCRGILPSGEVAERLMAALLKSAESKDFVGSNPTLSAR